MNPVPPLHPRRPITSTRQWRPLPGGLDFLGSGRLCGIEFVIQEPAAAAAAAAVAANSQENKPGSNADEMNTNNVNRLLQ